MPELVFDKISPWKIGATIFIWVFIIESLTIFVGSILAQLLFQIQGIPLYLTYSILLFSGYLFTAILVTYLYSGGGLY